MTGYVWNGSVWEREKSMHVWNGSIFEEVAEAWHWNAGAWERIYVKAINYTDAFTRANATTLGTGWTQGGTGSGIGITSNATSWANGGGTDGEAWAIRNADCAGNNQYVEVVCTSASSARDSRLILHANTGLTQFAYLNWYSNALYFGRSTGNYTSISDLANNTSLGVTIGSGTVIRFWNEGRDFKASINGVQKILYNDSSQLIARGAGNRRVGFGQERSVFANSGFITDFSGGDL